MSDVDSTVDVESALEAQSQCIRALQAQVEHLQTRVVEYDLIIERVGQAMEQAKQNPMVANMLRMLGIE